MTSFSQHVIDHMPMPSHSGRGQQIPLTTAQCSLLINGYSRTFYDERSLPSDLVRLCISFYSIWLDLKIIYCDDKTGVIDLNNYQIKAVLNESVAQVVKEIEDTLFREAIQNEYEKMCKLSIADLVKEPEMSFLSGPEIFELTPSTQTKFGEYASAKRMRKIIMAARFGNRDSFDGTYEFYKDRAQWDGQRPLVHVWQPFKHMKAHYPVYTASIELDEKMYDNEDAERWVEVPDDSELKQYAAKNFDYLVIERCNVTDWFEGTGTWPRQKGDEWRDTLQVGDIVEVKDAYGKDFESVIRYVNPANHMCVVHYIGWPDGYDEALDIDSDRIMKRYSNCSGPRRKNYRSPTKYRRSDCLIAYRPRPRRPAYFDSPSPPPPMYHSPTKYRRSDRIIAYEPYLDESPTKYRHPGFMIAYDPDSNELPPIAMDHSPTNYRRSNRIISYDPDLSEEPAKYRHPGRKIAYE